MEYLPLFARLQGTRCLVVGGGDVALRKLKLLQKAGAEVTVLAPAIDPGIRALAASGDIALREEAFAAQDFSGFRLIVAATDERAVNAAVAAAAEHSNILCNVVDDAEHSTAIMPAIIDRSPLVIAISSGGSAPVLATRIRQQLEQWLPPSYAALAEFAQRQRATVKATFATLKERRRFWQHFFAGPLADKILHTGQSSHDIDQEFAATLDGATSHTGMGWIVGAGPGDPELLTLKAARVLGMADTILHDRLVSPAVLDYARKDAEFISVGKQSGKPSISQDEINALLVARVAAGEIVCRLKGGDPFIFGRGGEEIEALEAAGLPWEVVPGITAAAGGAAATGIPLTHRNVARAVTFVTGSTATADDPDWQSLAAGTQTLVVYMAARKLERLCTDLIAAGRPTTEAAVIIENATTVRQRVIRGTLATLPELATAANIGTPALVMVGAVTELARLAADWTNADTEELWAAAAEG